MGKMIVYFWLVLFMHLQTDLAAFGVVPLLCQRLLDLVPSGKLLQDLLAEEPSTTSIASFGFVLHLDRLLV